MCENFNFNFCFLFSSGKIEKQLNILDLLLGLEVIQSDSKLYHLLYHMMIAKNKSLYNFPLRTGQNSRDYSIYSILWSFYFFPCEFWHLLMPAFLFWTLVGANYQDVNSYPLSRLSLCLSCPALVHVCPHISAQFSQWSSAKITHLCWTKQHTGLQAAKSLGVIHPKYFSFTSFLKQCEIFGTLVF